MGWFRHTMPKDRLARQRMPVADTTSTAKAMAYALVNASDPQAPVSPPVALGTPASVGTPGTGIAAPQTAPAANQAAALIPGSFAYMRRGMKRKTTPGG